MTGRESLNLRIKSGLREHIASIANEVEGSAEPRDLSKTAEKLIEVGLGIQMADNKNDGGILPTVSGPFGIIPRPWAEPSFDGEDVRLGTRVDAEVIEELQSAFGVTKHTAAKQALRLGIILINKDELEIRGPFGVERPFAQINIGEDLHGDRALDALDYLSKVVNNHERRDHV